MCRDQKVEAIGFSISAEEVDAKEEEEIMSQITWEYFSENIFPAYEI